MGIQNLHKLLQPAAKKVNLDMSWKGHRVGVDAMCWMHRGAYACAYELILGMETDRFVKFFMDMVRETDRFVKFFMVCIPQKKPTKLSD